ncbi:MAG: hypothetical protein AB1652_04070 [Bacillota bacterium]
MRIYIDGKLVEKSMGYASLDVLLRKLAGELRKEGLLISSVKVDGRQHSPDRLQEPAAEDVQVVEIETAPALEKLSAVLRPLLELLDTLQEAVREVYTYLQAGATGRAMQELAAVLEALDHVQGGLTAVKTLMPPSAVPAVNRGEITNNPFGHILPEMLQALEARDTVVMADLLEYELEPALARCRQDLARHFEGRH